MISKSYFKLSYVLFIATFLNACAVNNEIVIESSDGFQSEYFIGGLEIHFPSRPDIEFEPMPGASWILSGDISDIAREVIAELSKIDFEGLSNQSGSYMKIKTMNIENQDQRPGRVVYPIIVLTMQFDGFYNGVFVDSCNEVSADPGYPPPVEVGGFASRDTKRKLLQPVYEDQIKEALTQALLSGLNCLSNNSE